LDFHMVVAGDVSVTDSKAAPAVWTTRLKEQKQDHQQAVGSTRFWPFPVFLCSRFTVFGLALTGDAGTATSSE